MTSAGPIRVIIRNPSGLHARPAALFVRRAGSFRSALRVSNTTRGKGPADAKSILGVLALGVSRGHEIELSGEGEDADAAVEALRELIESGVGEEISSERGAESIETSAQPPAGAATQKQT